METAPPAEATCLQIGQLPVDQLCLLLQHADRQQRLNALQTLHEFCSFLKPAPTDDTPSSNDSSTSTAVRLFGAVYLQLIRCYADRFEQCRTLAAQCFDALLRALPRNQYYAEILVPLLQRRLGQPERIEDSEEVRLLLLQQLLRVVRKFTPERSEEADGHAIDPLLQCYNPIVDVLLKTLTDPYPAVPRVACEVIGALAVCSPTGFPVRAAQLVGPVCAMLGHRQLATRLAAVRTLGVIAERMHGESEATVRCIVSVSPLLMDEQAAVRAECARVGCGWLLRMRDRYSYFERLIPLALCGLYEDGRREEGERAEMEELWRECGRQYFEENEQELGRVELVDGQLAPPPLRYPPSTNRPSLGCRSIVQRSLRVCTIVCREMQDWRDDVRLHSMRLLWQIVLHAEGALTAHLRDVWPVLVRHCCDASAPVAAEALRCADLLGMLLPYADWSDMALAELHKHAHLGQLKCIVRMWRHAEPAARCADMRRVCEMLAEPAFSHSQREEFQQAMLEWLEVLIDEHLSGDVVANLDRLAIDAGATKSIEELLYTIGVKVAAMTNGAEAAVRQLNRLASDGDGDDDDNSDRLHSSYLPAILLALNADLDTENSEHAEPILLLQGLIRLGGLRPLTLDPIIASVQLCMQHAVAAARIRVLAAVSHAALGWRRTMRHADADDSVAALRRAFTEIIEPAVRWQAGRNAEAVRTMAVAVLRSMGDGAECEDVLMVFADSRLAEVLAQLVDDNNVVTRAYALGCARRCGPLQLDRAKALALAVLARLDDPSGEVRELAALALPMIRLARNRPGGYAAGGSAVAVAVGGDGEGDVGGAAEKKEAAENYAKAEVESWHAVVKHLMTALLLHLDSPEIKLRTRVADALIMMGRAYRPVADQLLAELPDKFYNKEAIDDIRTKISA